MPLPVLLSDVRRLVPASFSATVSSTLTGVVLGASVWLAGCSGSAPAGGPPAMGPLPVTVLEMQPRQVPNQVEVVAQTEGAKETEVRARVGGLLLKQMYQEGQAVKAGQVLFQIDPASYEIALAEAKARADQAERDMARLKKLVDVQGVSKKEFEDSVTAHELAQAALRQARLNLGWTTVTAPVSGMSGRALKSVGSLVGAGAGGGGAGNSGSDSLLTSVYQNDPMRARFSLSESEVARLGTGPLTSKNLTRVQLVLPDGSVYAENGQLNFLASSIDPNLGTQQLRAEFANKDGRLLPGQFVRVRLMAGVKKDVFLVPQSAVLQTEQGNLVMLAGADNKVTPRPIQTGDWLGRDWVVLGGLQAGDKVIVDNLMKLKPGAPVAPHGPTAPAASSPAPAAPAAPGAATPAPAPAKQG